MNTMNKEFKEQVQAHIINCLSTDQTEVLNEQLQYAVDGFKNWYSPYERKMQPNWEQAFQGWLMCLPSDLSVEYTHYGISETLAKWFTNCGMTYTFRKSDKEEQTYLHLIYREFKTLCKKNNVEFTI